MPLVPAICTQCGANIEVDNTHEAGICKFCGTAFITEKAINNYMTNITNNIVNKNNFAGANVVFQNNSESIEKLIENANTLIKLREYNKAKNTYHEITSKYPMDYRGWLGIIRSETEDMTKASQFNHNQIIDYFDKANKVANSIEQETVLKQKEKYETLYKETKKRGEDGGYIASICNKYNYADVEMALGCRCLNNSSHKFQSFHFVVGNRVEYSYTYNDRRFDGSKWITENVFKTASTTCQKNVTRDNIEQLLSGCNQKSGCYIATCVYGSYDCPEVWTLRRFRDYTLDETFFGKIFIKCYYAISPSLVKWFGEQKWFKSFWKKHLDKMIDRLNKNGVENTRYTDKY